MEPFLSQELLWWATAIPLPALGGLFWLVLKIRDDLDAAMGDLERATLAQAAELRQELAHYKLEVATTYASLAQMKDVEIRLTEHLLRIEAKLDHAARRATP